MKKTLFSLATFFLSASALASPPKVPTFKEGELTQAKVDQIVALRQVVIPALQAVPLWLETKYIINKASTCGITCPFSLTYTLPYNAHYLNLVNHYTVKGSNYNNSFELLVEDKASIDNFSELSAHGYTPPSQDLYALYKITESQNNILTIGDLVFTDSQMNFTPSGQDSFVFNKAHITIPSSCSIEKEECTLKVNEKSVYLNLKTGYVVINSIDALDPVNDIGFISVYGNDIFRKFLQASQLPADE